MGQNASVQQDHAEIGHEKRQFTSNSELMEFFDKRAVHMFTATELAAFKSKLEGKTLKRPSPFRGIDPVVTNSMRKCASV